MPVNVYSIDIPLVATAYIKANSPEEALDIANAELTDRGLEFSNRYQPIGEAVCMDGGSFEGLLDNEEDIALSPAVSLNASKYCLRDIDLAEELEVDVD